MFSRRRDSKDPPASADDATQTRAPQPPQQQQPNQGGQTQQTQDTTMADTSTDRAQTFRPEIPRRTPDLPVARATAAQPAPPQPAAAPVDDDEVKRLTVGKGIVLNGQITACDKLVVEGKVEATLSQSRAVEIAESGTFKGSAEIDEAVVSGRFEGKLLIRGRLSIRATGRVEGEIRYGQLEIEAGGQLVGDIGVYDESAGSTFQPQQSSGKAAGATAPAEVKAGERAAQMA